MQQQGKLNIAISYYQQAMTIDNSNASILYNFASANHDKGLLDIAIDYYKRTIKFSLVISMPTITWDKRTIKLLR